LPNSTTKDRQQDSPKIKRYYQRHSSGTFT
jgi:hypothetical protein